LANGHAKSEQGAQVIVPFPRDQEREAGLAGEVHQCTDGAEALAAYNCHRTDFVVMDIQIGPLDRITATFRSRPSIRRPASSS